MLLSCPAKKVTKERGIGEALSVALPRAKDALSYVPLPSRTNQLSVNLNGQHLLFGYRFTKADCSTTPALPIFFRNHPSGKKLEHFLSEQYVVKALQSHHQCATGDS